MSLKGASMRRIVKSVAQDRFVETVLGGLNRSAEAAWIVAQRFVWVCRTVNALFVAAPI